MLVIYAVYLPVEKAPALQRKKKQKANKKQTSKGIKDDNKEWLKPTTRKRKLDLSESEDDEMVRFLQY
jgi:hypothetical protein